MYRIQKNGRSDNMKNLVSASILSADMLNLEKEVRRLEASGIDMLHFDVMDGVFVPNISYGLPILSAIDGITDMTLDVHLMITDPLKYVKRFAESGADIITFHLESESDTAETIRAIRETGVKTAISVNPATPAEAVYEYLPLVDMVLVMTVEPGFGGQKFMADQLPKIAAFRKEILKRGLKCHIEVDGGIGEKNVESVVSNGANVLVAGTSVFRHPQGMAAGVKVLHDAKDKFDSAL